MPDLNPDGTVNLDPELPAHRDPAAIAHCGLCDDDGRRGAIVCDHVDRTDTARRGIAACREALAHKQLTLEETQ